MVFFCNIDDYAQLTHTLQVFPSPFLQKGDSIRLLFCISLSLFTKGRQLTAFACKSRKQRDFSLSLFTKGRQHTAFVLYFFSPFLQKGDSIQLLFCISLSLFTKGRQHTAFVLYFFSPFLQKGDSIQLLFCIFPLPFYKRETAYSFCLQKP
jgi:hypothetical protein